MLRNCTFFLCLALSNVCLTAQTFRAEPGIPIIDARPIESQLFVSSLQERISSQEFGLESVCINIHYEEVKHLIITLYSPDGTMVKLTHLNGRSEADHFANTCFGEHGKYFPLEHPPYYGGYQPVLPLGVVNNGQNPNGAWRLVVEELHGDGHNGLLESWSLTFGKHPAAYDTILMASELPILLFDTDGQHLLSESKISAHLRVAASSDGSLNSPQGPFGEYDGQTGIELHGSSSAAFWQQSFAFETRDSNGEDLDVPLLGMSEGSDWVLHGPFSDKSLLRNALTFTLANKTSAGYVPATRFCELVLNGSYLGVYTIIEKIKRGANRVDIAKMKKSDLKGDALTGGYIVKVDRSDAPGWKSNYKPKGGGEVYLNYVYPKGSDIQQEQMKYIQSFVDSFERALIQPDFTDPFLGWRKFADESSFVDHFIWQEVSKNVDAYRLSGFLFKPRDSEGGKLHAGPLWDFNFAWHNANYADNESPSGWTFQGEPYGVPFWWERLLDDPLFTQNLRCRWIALRHSVLSQRSIFSTLDSLSAVLDEAQSRHYALYPILGRGIYPNPKPIAKTHEEEILNMKYWISDRLHWMDANLQGICNEGNTGLTISPWSVFPNPVRETLTVFFEEAPLQGACLELVDMLGRVVQQRPSLTYETTMNMKGMKNGLYILAYRDKSGQVLRKEKIIKT